MLAIFCDEPSLRFFSESIHALSLIIIISDSLLTVKFQRMTPRDGVVNEHFFKYSTHQPVNTLGHVGLFLRLPVEV